VLQQPTEYKIGSGIRMGGMDATCTSCLLNSHHTLLISYIPYLLRWFSRFRHKHTMDNRVGTVDVLFGLV
jgi:hypothetical protein